MRWSEAEWMSRSVMLLWCAWELIAPSNPLDHLESKAAWNNFGSKRVHDATDRGACSSIRTGVRAISIYIVKSVSTGFITRSNATLFPMGSWQSTWNTIFLLANKLRRLVG